MMQVLSHVFAFLVGIFACLAALSIIAHYDSKPLGSANTEGEKV